jgi:putative holliday junction resolvase
MPALILPLAEAAAHLPARGALIGLDLGTKTIGVAASDPDRRLAAAVETIARKTFSADASRLPPNGKRSPSCSGFPSIWTAAKVRARNRRAPLRAISRV